MLKAIANRIRLYRRLHFSQYVYLNHFCKQVIRTDKSHILPYKHVVMDLAPSSKIYVGGGDLELGCDALKGSKEETRIRLRDDSIWSSEGGCRISYGATVEVLKDGLLDTGFFTMNSGSTIVTAKKIHLGRDVMIGRNTVIYDSDHHTIQNKQGLTVNLDKPVHIGDHVWLTSNVSVLKGSVIGSRTVIGAGSVVHCPVPSEAVYHVNAKPLLRKNYGSWTREHPENDHNNTETE